MIFFIAVAVVIIVGSAAGSWWWVTTRLSVTEGAAVYDIEEAADFAAGKLPDEVNQRLNRDQLTYLLDLHLAFFRRAGMATYGGVDEIAMTAAVTGETVVAHEDEAVDFVLQHLHDTMTRHCRLMWWWSLNSATSTLRRLGPSVRRWFLTQTLRTPTESD